jgi:hypothetical protein
LHSEENKMTSQLVKNNDSGKAQIWFWNIASCLMLAPNSEFQISSLGWRHHYESQSEPSTTYIPK